MDEFYFSSELEAFSFDRSPSTRPRSNAIWECCPRPRHVTMPDSVTGRNLRDSTKTLSIVSQTSSGDRAPVEYSRRTRGRELSSMRPAAKVDGRHSHGRSTSRQLPKQATWAFQPLEAAACQDTTWTPAMDARAKHYQQYRTARASIARENAVVHAAIRRRTPLKNQVEAPTKPRPSCKRSPAVPTMPDIEEGGLKHIDHSSNGESASFQSGHATAHVREQEPANKSSDGGTECDRSGENESKKDAQEHPDDSKSLEVITDASHESTEPPLEQDSVVVDDDGDISLKVITDVLQSLPSGGSEVSQRGYDEIDSSDPAMARSSSAIDEYAKKDLPQGEVEAARPADMVKTPDAPIAYTFTEKCESLEVESKSEVAINGEVEIETSMIVSDGSPEPLVVAADITAAHEKIHAEEPVLSENVSLDTRSLQPAYGGEPAPVCEPISLPSLHNCVNKEGEDEGDHCAESEDAFGNECTQEADIVASDSGLLEVEESHDGTEKEDSEDAEKRRRLEQQSRREFEYRLYDVQKNAFWTRRKENAARACARAVDRLYSVAACYRLESDHSHLDLEHIVAVFRSFRCRRAEAFLQHLLQDIIDRSFAEGKGDCSARITLADVDMERMKQWKQWSPLQMHSFTSMLREKITRVQDGEFAVETPYDARVGFRKRRRSQVGYKRKTGCSPKTSSASGSTASPEKDFRSNDDEHEKLGHRSAIRQVTAEVTAYQRLLHSLGYSEQQISSAVCDMYETGDILVEEKRLDAAVTQELLLSRRRFLTAASYSSDSDTSVDSDW